MKLLLRSLIIFLFILNYTYAEIVIAFDTQSMGTANKPSPHQKVELDKLQKIANDNNIAISFKAYPWKRSLLMVEKGVIDGVIQASYKTDRATYAKYPMMGGQPDSSKRLNDGNSYYIYRNLETPLRWDGKTFSHKGTVAAMDKYAVVEDLKKHPNITIQTFTNNAEIIRKLATKQIDAYAGSAIITDNLLKKFPALAKNIVRESLPIRKKDYFLIFSKITYKEKSKDMETLWNGLQKFNKK